MNSSLLNGKPTPATGTQCSHPQCKTYINTLSAVGVACPTCNRQYCLKHRLREEHACATLVPLGARPASLVNIQKQKALGALDTFRALIASKKKGADRAPLEGRKAPTTSSSTVGSLADIRRSAKGDARIPADKRLYLRVEAEAATTTAKLPAGNFFYNREWSVGRVLDEAAKGLQVQNVNNRGGGEEKKLRVYHVQGGRLLEFGEKVGVGLLSGNTIVLLRGVGPAVPDLMAV